MRCIACGSPEGRERPCCEDSPVFCDKCDEQHREIAHKEKEDDEQRQVS